MSEFEIHKHRHTPQRIKHREPNNKHATRPTRSSTAASQQMDDRALLRGSLNAGQSYGSAGKAAPPPHSLFLVRLYRRCVSTRCLVALCSAALLSALVLAVVARDGDGSSAAAAGGGAALPRWSCCAPLKQPDERRSPSRPAGGGGNAACSLHTELSVVAARVTVGGLSLVSRLYEGTMPGPTLRVCPGGELRVALHNRLGPGGATLPLNSFRRPNTTNLHLHGLHVSPAGDGDNPFLLLEPNGTLPVAVALPASHYPGTFWYLLQHAGTLAMTSTFSFFYVLTRSSSSRFPLTPLLAAMHQVPPARARRRGAADRRRHGRRAGRRG